MTIPAGPLNAMQAAAARVTGTFRATGASSALAAVSKAIRPFTEVGQRFAAAEETAKGFAALPKSTQRALTVVTVRCPGNELMLRVVRIPDHLPGARYDKYLIIPKGGVVTYRDDPDGQQRPWFLADHDLSYRLRCRCHREPVTLSPRQLHGESPPPPGIRVLRSMSI
ncbi:MAG: hypothetical protein DLM60_17520 [Pseudonocardiales bacterium]|nr:MAG: hypothetical protein DLM60_17520 [Pseudonocardiales bacterium]